MSAHGERVSEQVDLGDLKANDPETVLLDPKEAPQHMLDMVTVHPDGRELSVAFPQGNIGIRLKTIHKDGEEVSLKDQRFFPPVDASIDPDAMDQPSLIHSYPFVDLKDEDRYAVIVTATDELIADELSEPKVETIATFCTLADFRQAFPEAEVDTTDMRGTYTVKARVRRRPTLVVAVRVDDSEPAFKTQTVSAMGDKVIYNEFHMGGFRRLVEDPDLFAMGINGFVTQYEKKESGEDEQEADFQEFIFKLPTDGYQKTGPQKGMVEVVVFSTAQLELADFELTPTVDIKVLSGFLRTDTSEASPRLQFDPFAPREDKSRSPGGSSVQQTGETRAGKPQRIKMTTTTMQRPVPVAAFRFVLTGHNETV